MHDSSVFAAYLVFTLYPSSYVDMVYKTCVRTLADDPAVLTDHHLFFWYLETRFLDHKKICQIINQKFPTNFISFL